MKTIRKTHSLATTLTGEAVEDFGPKYDKLHVLEVKFSESVMKVIEFNVKN